MNTSIFKYENIIQISIIFFVACSILFLNFKLNYSDNERAITTLTHNNYSDIKNLDVGDYSTCAFKWYSKSVVGQTKFTATKNGITYNGTICFVAFGDDKIVLN